MPTSLPGPLRTNDVRSNHSRSGLKSAKLIAYGARCWSGRLPAGEALAGHGAARGVGLATIEHGRAPGARVIAAARGADHLAVGESTAPKDHRHGEAPTCARIKEVTDGRGGDIFQGRCAASPGRTDPGDRGFPSGQIPQIPATLLLVKHASAGGFCWGSYRQRDPARVRAAFEELPRWHGQGRIKSRVSEARPLTRAKRWSAFSCAGAAVRSC